MGVREIKCFCKSVSEEGLASIVSFVHKGVPDERVIGEGFVWESLEQQLKFCFQFRGSLPKLPPS